MAKEDALQSLVAELNQQRILAQDEVAAFLPEDLAIAAQRFQQRNREERQFSEQDERTE